MNLTTRITSDRELERWIAAGSLAGVETLVLWDGGLTDAGLEALAASPDAASLRYVDLSWNEIGPRGVRAMTRSPSLARLTSVRLYHNRVGAEGAHTIADSAWSLDALNLCYNGLGVRGVEPLCGARPLAALTSLALGDSELGDDGVAALAQVSWPALAMLNVRANHITAASVARLLSDRFAALVHLGLDDNPLGDDGVAALVRAPGFARLQKLNLKATELTERSLEVIAAAGTSLRELRLDDNDLDADAIARLHADPRLARCEVFA